MNYYPFHIGDYFTATAHLTWDEDHAFRLLLDLYYKEEAPLPSDVRRIARLLRVSDEAHLRALDSVLREFFTLTERGWVNSRCEAEISRTNGRREAASANAHARWNNEAFHGRARTGAGRRAAGTGGNEAARPNPAPEDPTPQAQCEIDAGAMRTHHDGDAGALTPHCERRSSAMRPQCKGNAPNTNTNPNTNTKPGATPAAAAREHDHAYARSSAGGAPAAAACVRPEGGGRLNANPPAESAQPDGPPQDPPQGSPPSATAGPCIADPPKGAADWHAFFLREGFAVRPLFKPETRALFAQWAARAITQGQMREAMERARAMGESPNSPAYYAWIIDGKSRGGVPARKTLASALHRIVPPAVLPPPVERL